MCLMLLDVLDLTLALTSEFLLVRCKLACSLACKFRDKAQPKAHLQTEPTHKKDGSVGCRKPATAAAKCYGHGSAKGRVRVDA